MTASSPLTTVPQKLAHIPIRTLYTGTYSAVRIGMLSIEAAEVSGVADLASPRIIPTR